ncbi:MAG TPA: response regulator, partial [Phycisphaerae bacterium]|nr:response regulator [Phycisphaerae bacterium]
ETHPDLVIVDLMMEEVDSGTSFVRDLQALGNTAPIYMLSSIGDRLYMNADYASLGLSGVFQKPIDPNTLLGVLRTRLN